ncbi:hypothetical protein B0T26DRAFT_693381 [Lasiosphaeria miniovina]|uniref:Uncharacterized protein n=1 Tax=Lasiosphaeria miniovina TaxID=1954250 RepID=A0AA40B3W3_9PEZI|nr:uncharacterized protein B0T26DRAFT_693381 [Lasiosphaeria miniovina]KAK0727182.1 hypothetical protein B0T26DRAFT_693381 [Lasiosphaeria miniovina]
MLRPSSIVIFPSLWFFRAIFMWGFLCTVFSSLLVMRSQLVACFLHSRAHKRDVG